MVGIGGGGHSCPTTSTSMLLPSTPTPPSTATPSQTFTGSAFKTGSRRTSSLPPGRRVTVVQPDYLPPSCCLPSTHPPASVKPCRQGRARASGRGGVEEADDVLRVGRRLKGLLVRVWPAVICCRKAGARVGRSSLPEKFKLPGRKGLAPSPSPRIPWTSPLPDDWGIAG